MPTIADDETPLPARLHALDGHDRGVCDAVRAAAKQVALEVLAWLEPEPRLAPEWDDARIVIVRQ